MSTYHRVMLFFAYVVGIIALFGILVDDRRDRYYSFHLWQALFFNLLIAMLASVSAVWIIPRYLLSLDVHLRTAFFLKSVLIPLPLILLLAIILGILAARGRHFRIPLLCDAVDKIVQ